MSELHSAEKGLVVFGRTANATRCDSDKPMVKTDEWILDLVWMYYEMRGR